MCWEFIPDVASSKYIHIYKMSPNDRTKSGKRNGKRKRRRRLLQTAKEQLAGDVVIQWLGPRLHWAGPSRYPSQNSQLKIRGFIASSVLTHMNYCIILPYEHVLFNYK